MSRCPECGEKACCGGEMVREIDALEAEVAEQCRLNAMGQERELKLRTEIKRLREALGGIKWRSADKDNMEFAATIICYQMDAILKALEGK